MLYFPIIILSNRTAEAELVEKTTTSTGLKVEVRTVDKQYDIGIKIVKENIDFKRIKFNNIIPKLSYSIAA